MRLISLKVDDLLNDKWMVQKPNRPVESLGLFKFFMLKRVFSKDCLVYLFNYPHTGASYMEMHGGPFISHYFS